MGLKSANPKMTNKSDQSKEYSPGAAIANGRQLVDIQVYTGKKVHAGHSKTARTVALQRQGARDWIE
jgi:hypothetical protein